MNVEALNHRKIWSENFKIKKERKNVKILPKDLVLKLITTHKGPIVVEEIIVQQIHCQLLQNWRPIFF